MFKEKFILLSFDVEEFDMPVEYGQMICNQEQMAVGYEGLEVLMNMIEQFQVMATFFTTANFAQHYQPAIRQIATDHEIASHSFYHSCFSKEDIVNSKILLEKITSKKVKGIRMPRMLQVNISDIGQAGYIYDSSIHPTLLPGRYNNLNLPRKPYVQDGLLRFPVSVSPNLRIPLFWLAFKNFPYSFYKAMVRNVLKRDGYVCLYFHPWEFISLDKYKIPGYTKRFAGKALQKRFIQLLIDLKSFGNFATMDQYISFHLTV
jgi:hypothetical protein